MFRNHGDSQMKKGSLFWAGLLTVAAVGAAVAVWGPFGDPAVAENLARSDKPAHLCVPMDRETLGALLRSESQAVLVVKSYQPPSTGNAEFKVSLVEAEGGEPRELTWIGMFPGGPFEAAGEDEFRRFSVPLSRVQDSLADVEELCLEVALEAPFGSAAGAAAKVDLEISPLAK